MTFEDTLNDPENVDAILEFKNQLNSGTKFVPFIGAGMSAPFGFKMWGQYLVHHAERGGVSLEVEQSLAAGLYEEAASILMQAMGPHAFHKAIQREFGTNKMSHFVPNNALKCLPKLTIGPVITTNYDRVLEETFRQMGVPFAEEAVGAKISASQRATESGARVLLKIHGDAMEISGRILTKEDYDDHYGDIDGAGFDPAKPLPTVLSKWMVGTPLLFLGCSLGQDRTMKVLAQITKQFGHGGHYAILAKPVVKGDFVKFCSHLSNHHITPIWYDPIDNHRLLGELLLHLTGHIPEPKPQGHFLKGQLKGPTDDRLQPNEPFQGRVHDLKELKEWLASEESTANVYAAANIKGAPGIGKSRLCHKAVSDFLKENPSQKSFYISLRGASNVDGLWARIADAYEWEDAAVAEFPDRMEAIGGVIYIDNLEDVLDDAAVLPVLRRFSNFKNAKVLYSSRMGLDHVARNMTLSRLDDPAAIRLFQQHWKLSNGTDLAIDAAAQDFIHQKLDNHPLSIKLVAGQGGSYANLSTLIADWDKAAMAISKTHALDPDKDQSLEVSITLSYKSIQSRSPDTIRAWALVCSFPEGMSQLAQSQLFPQDWVGPHAPQALLLHYHLAEKRDQEKIYMLSPIQAFMSDRLARGLETLTKGEIQEQVFQFLWPLATLAGQKYLSADSDRRSVLDAALAEFPSISHFVSHHDGDGQQLVALYDGLYNLFSFRSLLSVPILRDMVLVFRRENFGVALANALKSLGDLEFRLGNVDAAHKLYEEAIAHYQTEHANLGLANALKSLGELEVRLGNVDAARMLYEEAIAHYKTEHANLGLANALRSLGDLDRRLGNVDAARKLYEEAIGHYKTEHVNLGLANALQSLGDLEFRLGNVDAARKLYEEAIAHYQTERANLGLANTLRSLGDLEFRLGNVDAARMLYEAAIAHYQTERSNLGLANALKSLGDLDFHLGNVDAARKLYEEAIAHYQTEHDHLGLANALRSLGDLEVRLGNVDAARKLYEEAIGHYKTERANLGLANVLQSLGDLESGLGNVDAARKLYAEAITHYKTERNNLGLANSKLSWGAMELLGGNLTDAFAMLSEAAMLFEAAHEPMGMAKTLGLMALIFHTMDQHQDRDAAYGLARQYAEASHIPDVIAYVQNVGNQWGAT